MIAIPLKHFNKLRQENQQEASPKTRQTRNKKENNQKENNQRLM